MTLITIISKMANARSHAAVKPEINSGISHAPVEHAFYSVLLASRVVPQTNLTHAGFVVFRIHIVEK